MERRWCNVTTLTYRNMVTKLGSSFGIFLAKAEKRSTMSCRTSRFKGKYFFTLLDPKILCRVIQDRGMFLLTLFTFLCWPSISTWKTGSAIVTRTASLAFDASFTLRSKVTLWKNRNIHTLSWLDKKILYQIKNTSLRSKYSKNSLSVGNNIAF